MTITLSRVERGRIPEQVVPGKRLGRHVHFDSRSLAYPYRRVSAAPLVSVLHDRRIPILDQGDVGSCTGNAEVGALGTDPLFASLTGVTLNEQRALLLYSAAETIDGDGPYPPNDNGSSGLSVCKAAKDAGLISGYTHCLSLADVLAALQAGPVIIGSNWYDSFDTPASSGMVSIAKGAQVRGGHEYVARGIDVTAQTVQLDNSWGTSYGVRGSFTYSFATLERLLAEQGDGTVSVPRTQPAPVPVPVPTPPPAPPAPQPAADPADLALAAASRPWVTGRHTGANHVEARAVQAWLDARGL